MKRAKTSADRGEYLDRKMTQYAERMRADPCYDVWGWRRYRLLSYRNHVLKRLNRELAQAARKKYGKGGRV